MNATNEPTYYVSARFSGVGFSMNDECVPDDSTIIAANQIAPEVREAGRVWLAQHEPVTVR